MGSGGAGGAKATKGGSGGSSSFGSLCSANGGTGGGTATSSSSTYYKAWGGDGGSGGAGSTNPNVASSTEKITGGSDGSNGLNDTQNGEGQGTTTREFGEPSGELYAGGGGGAWNSAGGNGGSGVIIIRKAKNFTLTAPTDFQINGKTADQTKVSPLISLGLRVLLLETTSVLSIIKLKQRKARIMGTAQLLLLLLNSISLMILLLGQKET